MKIDKVYTLFWDKVLLIVKGHTSFGGTQEEVSEFIAECWKISQPLLDFGCTVKVNKNYTGNSCMIYREIDSDTQDAMKALEKAGFVKMDFTNFMNKLNSDFGNK